MEEGILFLCNQWSSSRGGIQTVNRELCKALGNLLLKFSNAPKIICLVEHATEDEMSDAEINNVKLLNAENKKTNSKYQDEQVLTMLWNSELDSINISAIIGHSKFTGLAARNVQDSFKKNAKVINFIHFDTELNERSKNIAEGEKTKEEKTTERAIKEKLDTEVILISDVVVPVGPLLAEHVESILNICKENKPKIVLLNCGMFKRELRKKQPPHVRFLMLGRTDDLRLKGIDIFSKASGIFVNKWTNQSEVDSPSPKFIVVGAPHDKVIDLEDRLRKDAKKSAGGNTVELIVKSYKTDREEIEQEILKATALVMPSRAEGYGLVALDAASHGVPVIVSAESGVGLLLSKKLPRYVDKKLFFISVRDEQSAPEELAEILLKIAKDEELARSMGELINFLLRRECLWEKAAYNLARNALGFDLSEQVPTYKVSDKLPESLNQFIINELSSIPHSLSIIETPKIDSKIQETLHKAAIHITETYRKMETKNDDYVNELTKIDEDMLTVSNYISKYPYEILFCWSSENFESYFELKVVEILLSKGVKGEVTELFALFLREVISLLTCVPENDKAFSAVLPAVESLVVALQDLDWESRQKGIRFLAALAGESEDRTTIEEEFNFSFYDTSLSSLMFLHSSTTDTFQQRTLLSQLLQTGLYSEVFEFVKLQKNLPQVEKVPQLTKINSSVISLLSRKGGTGKSVVSMLSILSYIETNPGAKVCLLDLDLTGPTWQYLLFPEGDKPNRFLNELIDEEQLTVNGLFSSNKDGNLSLDLLFENKSLPDLTGTIQLLTLRDLPRTNRLLIKAIQNNPNAFFEFLLKIIEYLDHNKFDLIVIDNSPGFGLIPLLSHSISSNVGKGASLVVSTPYLPDIRGIFIDLSDERLLYKGNSPIWIINKTTKEVEEFLKEDHNIVEIAQATKAFATIVPYKPLVTNILTRRKYPYIALPLDHDLLKFATITEEIDPIKVLKDSHLMVAFKNNIAPLLSIKTGVKFSCS